MTEQENTEQENLIFEIKNLIGRLRKLKPATYAIMPGQTLQEKSPSVADEEERKRLTGELRERIEELTAQLAAEAYAIAARKDNYTSFYDKSSNLLFVQAPLTMPEEFPFQPIPETAATDKTSLRSATAAPEQDPQQQDAGTIRRKAATQHASLTAERVGTLRSIRKVSISNSDATKEINQLLDHTSIERITEEMDIHTYNTKAENICERIRAEFREEQEKLSTAEQDTGSDGRGRKGSASHDKQKQLSLIKSVEGAEANVRRLQKEVKPIWLDSTLLNPVLPKELWGEIFTIGIFLSRYRRFLKYVETSANLMQSDFGAEGFIQSYLDATEQHARRIEKEGLFASWRTISTGAWTGLAVIIILFFFDHNFVFKNWAIWLTCIAAGIAYMLSIIFGKSARAAHMKDLRQLLDTHICDIFRAGLVVPAGARKEAPFKFPKIQWKLLQARTPLFAGLDRSISLENKFARRATDTWVHLETDMLNGNLAAFALIGLIIPLSISGLLGTLSFKKKDFDFVSLGNGHGSCLLKTGHVLLAAGQSYFIVGDKWDITELSKSSVYTIRPASDRNYKLSDCAESKPNGKPIPISLAEPIDAAQSIGAAAKLIADKIPPGGGCQECRPPETASNQTIVVPILIESKQPTTMPDIVQEGPIFTTQLVSTDGTVREIGGQDKIILPFFTDPVTGRDAVDYAPNGVDQPWEAFHFGLNHVNDPVLSGKGKERKGVAEDTLLKRIGSAFKRCVSGADTKEAGGTSEPALTLSIRGFASEEWTGQVGEGTSKEELNWYLAEGRRLAVIEALDIRKDSRIGVNRGDGAVGMEALSGISRKTTSPDQIRKMRKDLEAGFQFTQATMPVALGTWLKEIIGDGQPDQGEMRVLARSVVVEIEENALANCGVKKAQKSVAN
jgi:hypothetical protein